MNSGICAPVSTQVGEVVGGIFAHSLAVLTDAAHMLSDVLAFIISLAAGSYALRPSKASYTFGYHRAEVLGGLVSKGSAMALCAESDQLFLLLYTTSKAITMRLVLHIVIGSP